MSADPVNFIIFYVAHEHEWHTTRCSAEGVREFLQHLDTDRVRPETVRIYRAEDLKFDPAHPEVLEAKLTERSEKDQVCDAIEDVFHFAIGDGGAWRKTPQTIRETLRDLLQAYMLGCQEILEAHGIKFEDKP